MFGFSIGKKKNTTVQDSTQTVDGTQTQTGTNTNTQTGTSSTQGSQSSTSSGSSSTTQGSSGSALTTQTGSSFGSQALGGINANIEQFITQILGGGAGNRAISELGEFDANEFVNGIMQSATSQANDQLGESIRGAISNIGGSQRENSATALLANRMENATSASLAGTQSQAVKTAQDIMTQRSGAVTAAGTGEQNALAQILNAIKGGESSTTGVTEDSRQQTGTTQSNEATNQQSQQATQTMQSAIEIINQLLRNNTTTVGHATGTESSSGGGFSFGI